MADSLILQLEALKITPDAPAAAIPYPGNIEAHPRLSLFGIPHDIRTMILMFVFKNEEVWMRFHTDGWTGWPDLRQSVLGDADGFKLQDEWRINDGSAMLYLYDEGLPSFHQLVQLHTPLNVEEIKTWADESDAIDIHNHYEEQQAQKIRFDFSARQLQRLAPFVKVHLHPQLHTSISLLTDRVFPNLRHYTLVESHLCGYYIAPECFPQGCENPPPNNATFHAGLDDIVNDPFFRERLVPFMVKKLAKMRGVSGVLPSAGHPDELSYTSHRLHRFRDTKGRGTTLDRVEIDPPKRRRLLHARVYVWRKDLLGKAEAPAVGSWGQV